MLKNQDNIQPYPNPKPLMAVRVPVTMPGQDGRPMPAGFGILRIPLNGRLRKSTIKKDTAKQGA